MKKKILFIVSIMAVVILIFASFTSVIGFRSVKFTSIKSSPLFNTRTKKAIRDEDRSITTFNYIGKDKRNVIQIPKMEDKIKLLIDRIKNMDSKTLNRLKLNINKQARYNDDIKNEDIKVIMRILEQMREKTAEFTDAQDCTTKPFYICEWLQNFLRITKNLAIITTFIITMLIGMFWMTVDQSCPSLILLRCKTSEIC